ncbi:urease accessory protein [Paenibacillus phyllosphaerae]|uniref:Urease accessory protein UreF n=1 Tax=Paenibacillus phyllosphaerae TaxID=274593 RepID=A0A7W5ASY7_9BACL|nr:urease accessory protein UreF [Paenibacillus phyllosphaerae]MBB3108210.1 urease accessory protein [Paenibacillus phyllosphaerae]
MNAHNNSAEQPIVPWLALQQLLDSALPIGGFSHSFGLETLVQEGRLTTSAQLEAYVRAMLRQSWATSDAMIIKAAYRDIPEGQWERLFAVERLVHLQRVAFETRSGIEKMGRRLLQLLGHMFPQVDCGPIAIALRDGRSLSSHPLVFGMACVRLGIPLEQAVQGYLYTCIVTCINSALRLISMGQMEGQSIIARLTPAAAAAWQEVRELEPEDAYTNMPMAELAMIRHETLYSRLFMS